MLPFNLGFIVVLKLISVQALLTSVASLYEELQLDPPDDALVSKLSNDIHRRVPLSTNDDTPSPLIELQVYPPPHVPQGGDSCQVTLLTHEFGDGSYGVPATVDYSPPIDKKCGPVGEWSGITLNVTVYSIGTQYDRLSVCSSRYHFVNDCY
ncbi:hypothetical protein C8Q75DRAFT_558964 [Abortiporus biennis]|nr:hypothetical protein C8Q75DRAFT_558964 [Abortiporus biennis]